MDNNQQYFISILSDHISGKNTTPKMDVDWELIRRLSKSHQVDGIVYFQCRMFMPPDILKYYEKVVYATLFFFQNRKTAMQEVSECLSKNQITFFPMKGFSIAQYYPIPELRTMGDCDILVNKKDMPVVMDIMRELGYQGIDNEKADSWECRKNDLLFEIHTKLVQDNEHCTKQQLSFFNNYSYYVNSGIMDWDFCFLFFLMHLRKHFMNSGVGIRLFMDIAVVVKYGPVLDWKWIEAKLQELELLKFAQVCFYFINRWFNIDIPLKYDPVDDGFYHAITEKILRNGVFGLDDLSNRGNYARIVLLKSKGVLWGRRVKLIISSAFPAYRYMKSYPGCGYVDGRPYLIPIAWVHRWIMYPNRTNKTTIKKTLRHSLSDRKKLKEQQELLERMGL